MRAPIPSFKKELAAFRARPERPCGKAVEGLLDRWLKHGQSEESWRTIRQYIPALSAEDLITQVLKARWSAAGQLPGYSAHRALKVSTRNGLNFCRR